MCSFSIIINSIKVYSLLILVIKTKALHKVTSVLGKKAESNNKLANITFILPMPCNAIRDTSDLGCQYSARCTERR